MNHEYILMYTRDKENFVIKMDVRNDQNIATFKNEDNDPRRPWISSPLLAPTFSNSTVFPIIILMVMKLCHLLENVDHTMKMV